jgi:hypothetical protein
MLLLDTTGTPQSNALTWIAYQDPARLGVNDTHLLYRYILSVFFFSTSGQPFSEERPQAKWKTQDHWMTERSICRWYGVHCVGESTNEVEHVGDVLTLNLSNNNINGTLPLELHFMDLLERIDFSQNDIQGSVPTTYALFQNLRDLFLRAGESIDWDGSYRVGKHEVVERFALGAESIDREDPDRAATSHEASYAGIGEEPADGDNTRIGKCHFVE